MGTLAIVVVDVLCQQMIEVPGSQHDEMIEAFQFDALDQPLDIGIQVGRSPWQLNGVDSSLDKRPIEAAGSCSELTISITEQKLGSCHAGGDGLDEALHRRSEPLSIRIGGASRDVRPASARVNEDKAEGVAQPLWRENPSREEVARPERLGVTLQELGPCRFAALRTGGKPVLAQNVDDGAP